MAPHRPTRPSRIARVLLAAALLVAGAPLPSLGQLPSGLIMVEASVSAARESDRGLTLRGTTNLPDGTRLGVTLSARNGAILAQDDKAVVVASSFRAGPFFVQGRPLPAGSYQVEIVSLVGARQPANVLAAIGARGERMTGRIVAADRQGRHLMLRRTLAVP